MNIYLDIDGTLLHKDGTPANHLFEFLDYVVNNHDVYWLTTHCRGGVNCTVEHMTMKNNISRQLLDLLNRIQPTDWYAWKTEAIDFKKDFLWLDDYAFDGEKVILKKNRALKKLIIMDLRSNSNQLRSIIDIIKSQLISEV